LVAEAGDALHQYLVPHNPYKTAILSALGIHPKKEVRPIFFRFDLPDEEVEELPWEALRAATPPTFLTLDARWPVGRISGDYDRDIRPPFEEPVRVLVVLAALGVSGLPQLRELLAAFDNATNVKWKMTVLTKDEDVLNAINNRPAGVCPVVGMR